LSERKQERLTQKLSSPVQPVVFEILRDSACSECGTEVARGSFLVMEAEQPLEYLPAGDAALTRRSSRIANARLLSCASADRADVMNGRAFW
jgi:hypothetical protein